MTSASPPARRPRPATSRSAGPAGSGAGSSGAGSSGAGGSGTLRWAVRLLYVEAVAAALLAGLLTYQGIAGAAADRGNAFALAGFAVVIAAALAGLGWLLARRKPRARAPAIVLQLLGVMIGLALLTGGGLVGLPVVVLGVAVATLLLTPSTHEALAVRSSSAER